jgi:hypothetical protein
MVGALTAQSVNLLSIWNLLLFIPSVKGCLYICAVLSHYDLSGTVCIFVLC